MGRKLRSLRARKFWAHCATRSPRMRFILSKRHLRQVLKALIGAKKGREANSGRREFSGKRPRFSGRGRFSSGEGRGFGERRFPPRGRSFAYPRRVGFSIEERPVIA